MQKVCRSLPVSQKDCIKHYRKKIHTQLTLNSTGEGTLCFYNALTAKKKASF